MERLSEVVDLRGTGIHGLKAKLVDRQGNICVYQRTDNVFEVFIVKVSPAVETFGKSYPEREKYPGNEDFGYTAWCYSNEDNARKKFKMLCQYHLNDNESSEDDS